jgi:hypothetical protein
MTLLNKSDYNPEHIYEKAIYEDEQNSSDRTAERCEEKES